MTEQASGRNDHDEGEQRVEYASARRSEYSHG